MTNRDELTALISRLRAVSQDYARINMPQIYRDCRKAADAIAELLGEAKPAPATPSEDAKVTHVCSTCKAARYSDGKIAKDCDEPCSFIMGKRGSSYPDFGFTRDGNRVTPSAPDGTPEAPFTHLPDLRKTLIQIAGQKMSSESTADEQALADYQGGWDECILRARAALGSK